MQAFNKCGLFVAAVVVAVVLILFLWEKWEFPYGNRGCVLKCINFALASYAQDHHGQFPVSEKGPFQALCKLYPTYLDGPQLFAGLSGDRQKVGDALRRGVVPPEDLTSLVYIQGFNRSDDSQLAILWDKTDGLSDIGGRMGRQGHSVGFVDGGVDFIPRIWLSESWEDFLKKQKALRKNRETNDGKH